VVTWPGRVLFVTVILCVATFARTSLCGDESPNDSGGPTIGQVRSDLKGQSVRFNKPFFIISKGSSMGIGPDSVRKLKVLSSARQGELCTLELAFEFIGVRIGGEPNYLPASGTMTYRVKGGDFEFLSFSAEYPAKPAGRAAGQISVRRVKLTVKGDTVFARDQQFEGDHPFMLTVYDSRGKLAGGLGALNVPRFTMSGDLSNTLLDLSGIPKKHELSLGVQRRGDESQVIVGIARRLCAKALIDGKGVVFPDEAQHVGNGGPFIGISFKSAGNRPISLKSMNVNISGTVGGRYKTVVVEDDTLLVMEVARETLRVELQDRLSKEKWNVDLFPMFRGATKGVVLYNVLEVAVGKAKQKLPEG